MIYHSSLRLAESFYCYLWEGRGNNCNTSLLCHTLRGERPHILVDPGHIKNELGEPCFDSLTQAMEKDGFKTEDIGLVLCTHCHPDHFEAVDAIVNQNTIFALSREEEQYRQEMGKLFFSTFGAKLPQVKPFFYLTEGNLNLGMKNKGGPLPPQPLPDEGHKVNLRVLLTPGHSPGSISFYMEEEKILISGDVVFFGSVGRTDIPGGSPSVLRQSIDKLSQLDVEYLVPGHTTELGNVIAGKEKVKHNFQMVKMLF